MVKVSVLSSTFNRAKLLDLALASYAKQSMPFTDWEYVLVDDGSQDNTLDVVEKWKNRGLPIRAYDAAADLGKPKTPGKWRDGSIGRNAGSLRCTGDVLVATHPEIIIPPDALELAYRAVQASPQSWHTAIPYWVPPDESWNQNDWDNNPNVESLRRIQGFENFFNHHDCRPNHEQERCNHWETEIWWSMSMDLWRKIGGFREFEVWGPVDVDFMNRRKKIGIDTQFIMSPISPSRHGIMMVYHQWHESPRNHDLCIQTLVQMGYEYADASHAIAAGALHNK